MCTPKPYYKVHKHEFDRAKDPNRQLKKSGGWKNVQLFLVLKTPLYMVILYCYMLILHNSPNKPYVSPEALVVAKQNLPIRTNEQHVFATGGSTYISSRSRVYVQAI